MTWKPDLLKIQALVESGHIAVQKHPTADLRIYNYTQRTQFDKVWNAETINCRGLILDSAGCIVARPFRKFFNYGERLPVEGAKLVSVTEKMDGSLGILYWDGLRWAIATRGSFTSDQAVWATRHLHQFHTSDEYAIYDSYTLLFEIIYPENRVVVDYKGWSGLVLIGARHIEYGYEMTDGELDALAGRLGFMRPKTYTFENETDILSAAERLSPNEEGWVLRYSDNERYKVKGAAYLAVHRALTGMNFNHVLEAVAGGAYDQLIAGIPDEFLGQVREWKQEIDRVVAAHIEGATMIFRQAKPEWSRKEFAAFATQQGRMFTPLLFALYDGKAIEPLIYKRAFEGRVEKTLLPQPEE